MRLKYYFITVIFVISISSCATSYSARLIDERQLDVMEEYKRLTTDLKE